MFPITSLLNLLAACGGDTVAPAPPVEAPQVEVEVPAEVDHTAAHAQMRQHFEAVTSARNAIIAGDLEGARTSLAWLAEHETPEEQLPQGWAPHIGTMQTAARQAAAGETIEDLADAVGKAAMACGQCHNHFQTGPEFGTPGPTPQGARTKDHMKRHQWAADRMWEGLVEGNTDQWVKGALVMREAHLDRLRGGNAKRVKAHAVMVHELGGVALSSMTPSRQALVYGDFIATCGACHAETGRGPSE